MEIDHIGIACSNLEVSINHYLKLGFKIKKEKITDFGRNLNYVFLENDGYKLELISKFRESEKSDIDVILSDKKLLGNKIYHICYISNDLLKDMEILQATGYKVLKEPSTAIACDNKRVVFLMHFELGIVELLENGTNDALE